MSSLALLACLSHMDKAGSRDHSTHLTRKAAGTGSRKSGRHAGKIGSAARTGGAGSLQHGVYRLKTIGVGARDANILVS